MFGYSNTFFSTTLYAFKLARVILYSCESECISLSLLRSLDLSKASVVHVDFLCLYFLNFTVLYGICLSLAGLITSCNML